VTAWDALSLSALTAAWSAVGRLFICQFPPCHPLCGVPRLRLRLAPAAALLRCCRVTSFSSLDRPHTTRMNERPL